MLPKSFQTARLEAERIAARHIPALQALHRDPEAMAGLGGVRGDEETERYLARNVEHWDTHGFGVWMLRTRGGDGPIGRVTLRWFRGPDIHDVEIGYAFERNQWGRGFATEAATFALDLARSRLALRTVVGITTPENRASQRVLEKIGLRYERDFALEDTTCRLYRVRW